MSNRLVDAFAEELKMERVLGVCATRVTLRSLLLTGAWRRELPTVMRLIQSLHQKGGDVEAKEFEDAIRQMRHGSDDLMRRAG